MFTVFLTIRTPSALLGKNKNGSADDDDDDDN